MEYIAFISYRHMPLPSAAAEKLAAQIEQFVIPKRLRRDGKRRLGRVFRDRDELPLSSSLGDDLYRALDQSEYLIVVCTPEILESRYCMEEVRYFLEKHDREHVLTVLASGTPETSFPPALLAETDPETGEERSIEPLAADIRAGSLRESLKKLKKEKLRLIAPILGCKYDDLAQRMKRRRRRRALAALAAVCAVAAAFAVLAVNMGRKNLAERENRIIREAMLSAEQSRTYLSGGRANEALEAALAAFPAMPDGTVLTTPEGILALSNAGRFCETGTVVPCGVLESEEKIISLGLSPDGRTVSVNGNRYDAVTLELLPAETQDWEIPEGETALMRDQAQGRLLLDTGDAYVVRRLSDGEKLGEASHGSFRTAEDFVTTQDGDWSFVLHWSSRGPYDGIYDAIGQSVTDAGIFAFGPDGAVISYDVPFDANSRLMPSGHFCVYPCREGLYLVDPACRMPSHAADEAGCFFTFSEYYDASYFLPVPGKKTTLLIGGNFLIAFDTDAGPVINMEALAGHGAARACAWTDETETRAVILMEDGAVCHYFDDRNRQDGEEMSPGADTRYKLGVTEQADSFHAVDLAVSADAGPVCFAAVSGDETQAVRLYTYLRNERAELISDNTPASNLVDIDMPAGTFLRYDGTEGDDRLYTILDRGENGPSERTFTRPSGSMGIVGISADGKEIYTSDSTIDLETGEVRDMISPMLRTILEVRYGHIAVCDRDSRGSVLRLFVVEGFSADDRQYVTAMRDGETSWLGMFPVGGNSFFDSTIGDQTSIGKNGWAVTPLEMPDGTFATVLTELYGERYTVLEEDTSQGIVIEGYDTSHGLKYAIGTDPDHPVLVLADRECLRIVNCEDGSAATELPMPVPADSLRNVCFLQDDRYILLAQTDMTVLVVDASDGTVVFRRTSPDARMAASHLMLLRVYETDGEFTVSFVNRNYGDYAAGFSVRTDSWQVIREIPRLYLLDYPGRQAVVLDGTLLRSYRIPLMTPEEMLEAAGGTR